MFGQLSSFSKVTLLAFAGLLSFLVPPATEAQPRHSSAKRIYAQRQTLAAHSELVGLELAATPPTKSQCVTIASSEAKGIGEKCDKDEYTAMKTNKPFVEKEMESGKQVYDVTIPIHDAEGKIIATAGIDFKAWPDQAEAWVTDRSLQIAREIESKIKSKQKLFQPVA
jgi:hypothetical protein